MVKTGKRTEAHHKSKEKGNERRKGKEKTGSLLFRLTVSKGLCPFPAGFVTEKLVEIVVFFYLFFGFKVCFPEVLKAVCGQIRCVWLAHQIEMKMKWNDQFALL